MTTYILSKLDGDIRGKSFVYLVMKKIIGDKGIIKKFWFKEINSNLGYLIEIVISYYWMILI